MLIKGEEAKRSEAEHTKVTSMGKHPLTPGEHFIIVDTTPNREKDQHTTRVIDGQSVRLVNGMGATESREMAIAAANAGLTVVPREKHVARGMWTMPEMPWKKKGETNVSTDRGEPAPDARLCGERPTGEGTGGDSGGTTGRGEGALYGP